MVRAQRLRRSRWPSQHSAHRAQHGAVADAVREFLARMSDSRSALFLRRDGFSVSDVDWDTEDGHYRVLLRGEWINVPNSSVVTEPNRYGPAVVWPYVKTWRSRRLEGSRY
jgi:hypothetical protein